MDELEKLRNTVKKMQNWPFHIQCAKDCVHAQFHAHAGIHASQSSFSKIMP